MDDHDDRMDRGADEGRRRRFRLGARVWASVAAAAVGGVILVGLTTAGAQTASPTSPATPSPGVRPPGPPHGPGGWGPHGGGFEDGPGGTLGGILHGQLTTVDPSGGYRTIDVQTGTVTAVSASSITVKSQDGFSRTYGVDTTTTVEAGRNGIADVKVGHIVHVAAKVTGSTTTAVVIFDRSNAARLGGRWMPPRRSGSAWTSPTATTGA
jgi:hypothetical protein